MWKASATASSTDSAARLCVMQRDWSQRAQYQGIRRLKVQTSGDSARISKGASCNAEECRDNKPRSDDAAEHWPEPKKKTGQVALPGQRLVRRIAPRPSPAGPAAA